MPKEIHRASDHKSTDSRDNDAPQVLNPVLHRDIVAEAKRITRLPESIQAVSGDSPVYEKLTKKSGPEVVIGREYEGVGSYILSPEHTIVTTYIAPAKSDLPKDAKEIAEVVVTADEQWEDSPPGSRPNSLELRIGVRKKPTIVYELTGTREGPHRQLYGPFEKVQEYGVDSPGFTDGDLHIDQEGTYDDASATRLLARLRNIPETDDA